MKDSTLRIVYNSCHAVDIYLNDTFSYASSESITIDRFDLDDLEPIIDLYEGDAFVAYESLRRNELPIEARFDFFKAKAAIQEMLDTKDYLVLTDLRTSIKHRLNPTTEQTYFKRFLKWLY
jgi:hypothetical protein